MTSVQYEGKAALVTGANRGIGRAITEGLLGAGVAKVYTAVRTPSSAQPLVDEYGDRVVPVEFDLGKDDLIRAAAQKAADVSIVINNAGVLRTSGVLDDDAYDSLAFELDNNLLGLMRTARAFTPVLERNGNGNGAFVQLNSVVSVKNFPNFATYSASKAASYSITQALRADLGERGIQVFSVHPGPIATDMGSAAGLDDIAEPPSLVADAIIAAFNNGNFHVFPDSMAQQIGAAYASFAENVVEADLSEG